MLLIVLEPLDAINTPFCSCPRCLPRVTIGPSGLSPIHLPVYSDAGRGLRADAGGFGARRLREEAFHRRSARSLPLIRSGETGLASWYGHPYHGRPAANGEIYDMEALTAAHRTLPFGTWVRVVNLSNDKTVDVRITDRGPFVENRIIDLSHAAAVAIDLIGPGVARVRLDILSVPTVASSARTGTECKPGPSWIPSAPNAFARRSSVISVRRIWCSAPIAQPSGAWWWDAFHPLKPPPLWLKESGKNLVLPL